jgi:sugar phosphate isomerase/epimerase
MARPVTLFTGQWADLSIDTMCQKASEFGYDGLELACWGDHFDVQKALKDRGYCDQHWQILMDYGLNCYAISNHLIGQAVCDLIDERHKAILPPDIWGDGSAEGVRRRAAKRMADTAKACRKFFDARPGSKRGVKPSFAPVVCGFTGSSIWHAAYAFPPTDQAYVEKGFADFAKRWGPILSAFEKVNVNFALEVHPTEIAFDVASARRALKAVKHHKRFGFNYDPSHFGYQGVDCVKFIYDLGDRIYHAHMKDVWWGHGDGSVGVFGGHTDFGDPRRYWDFRSLGHGDINFEEVIVALNDVGYNGPLSVEWEDMRMDREAGAAESCEFVRSIDFERSNIVFDKQFKKK